MTLSERIKLEIIVELMLSSESAWDTISAYATEVLIDLRAIERRRTNGNN